MRYAFEPVISVPSNSTKFLRPLHVFTKGRKGESEGTSLIFRLRLRSNPRHTRHQFFTQIPFALDTLHYPRHFYAADPTTEKRFLQLNLSLRKPLYYRQFSWLKRKQTSEHLALLLGIRIKTF